MKACIFKNTSLLFKYSRRITDLFQYIEPEHFQYIDFVFLKFAFVQHEEDSNVDSYSMLLDELDKALIHLFYI